MFTEEQKIKIQSKLGNLRCPVCGKQELLLTDEPTHVIGFKQTDDAIDFSKVNYVNCLCVECLNCGYMMQFRLDKLLK